MNRSVCPDNNREHETASGRPLLVVEPRIQGEEESRTRGLEDGDGFASLAQCLAVACGRNSLRRI